MLLLRGLRQKLVELAALVGFHRAVNAHSLKATDQHVSQQSLLQCQQLLHSTLYATVRNNIDTAARRYNDDAAVRRYNGYADVRCYLSNHAGDVASVAR